MEEPQTESSAFDLKKILQTYPHIFKLILSFLRVSDLKACRRVSTEWEVKSSEAMRLVGKVDLKLFDNEPLKFLEVMENRHSTLKEVPFTDNLSFRRGQAVESLMGQICGVHIKSLQLSTITFETRESFFRLVFEQCPNLSNLTLQHIQLQNTNSEVPIQCRKSNVKSLTCDDNTAKVLRTDDVSFLANFPGLQELYINRYSRGINELLRSLVSLRASCPNLWNLKKISWDFMYCTETPNLLHLFVESGLRLEAIGIDIFECWEYESGEMDIIRTIVGAHAATLKKLYISDDKENATAEADTIFRLPDNGTYPELKELKLCRFGLGQLNFLDLFPKLSALHITMGESQDLLEGNNSVYPNVTELSVEMGDRWVLQNELHQLHLHLPNVKKLTLNLVTDEAVALACQLWPHLEVLTLENTRLITDAGLTGYNKADVRRMNREGPASSWRPTVQRANLTSLTNLESFVCGEPFLPGYATAVCGLLELPRLQNLAFGAINLKRPLPDYWAEVIAARPGLRTDLPPKRMRHERIEFIA